MNAFLSRCKLCKTLAVLQRRHVVPRWSFGRAAQALDLEEALLCTSCERRLADDEVYVASVGLHDDAPFTACDLVRPLPDLSGGGFVIGDASMLEHTAIVRFGVAVLWRASVSQAYRDVHLGERYEDALGSYLLRDDARFPDHARLMVELFASPRDVRHDRLVLSPTSENAGAFHVHRFALYGFSFHLVSGALLPAGSDAVCFERTKRALLSDATSLVPSFTSLLPSIAHAPGTLRPPRGRVGLQRSPRVD
jgi:hypothetical protein